MTGMMHSVASDGRSGPQPVRWLMAFVPCFYGMAVVAQQSAYAMLGEEYFQGEENYYFATSDGILPIREYCVFGRAAGHVVQASVIGRGLIIINTDIDVRKIARICRLILNNPITLVFAFLVNLNAFQQPIRIVHV